MIKKSVQVATGVLLSTILFSNGIFVYANDSAVFEYINNITVCDKDIINNNNDKHIVIMNILRPNQIIYNDDKNKYLKTEEEKDDDNNDNDNDTLGLLNMTMDEYREQLKNGENLQSLLEKNNVTEQFKSQMFENYENILETAVKNNSITKDEMYALLEKFEENQKI